MNNIKFKVYKNKLSLKNKMARLIWNLCYLFIFRLLIGRMFAPIRVLILQIFGAKIGKGCNIYSSVKIWAPWRLILGDYVVIGPHVYLYNTGKIIIHSNSTVSQNCLLCSGSHDISSLEHDLIMGRIIIHSGAWIAMDAFIGMDVIIGEGSVVGARACVFKDVEPWSVVGGNPAKFLKKREFIV